MGRKYNTYAPYQKHGQEVVQPFVYEDWEKMTQYCLLQKEKAANGSISYYIWYRNYMILLIGVNVGARISDLLEFTPRTFAGGKCEFTAHKTGKPIRYTIDKKVYQLIKAYIDEFKLTTNQFLFRATDSHHKNIMASPITRTQAWRMIKKVASKCGIDYMVGTHSLRKSYGRWQYDAGVNLSDVSASLQHEDPITTLRYICIDSEQIKENREHIHYVPRFIPKK